MSLKIRLARGGAKKRPFYSASSSPIRAARATAASSRRLGTYNPMLERAHRRPDDAERGADPALARGRRTADRPGRAVPRRCRADRQAGAARHPEANRRPRPRRRNARKAAAEAAAPPPAAADARSAAGRSGRTMHDSGGKRDLRRRGHRPARASAARVRIKSFTARPEDIAAYGPLADETGERRFELRLLGTAKGVLIARLAGRRGSRPRGGAARPAPLSAALGAAAAGTGGILSRRPDRARSGAGRRVAARAGARGA